MLARFTSVMLTLPLLTTVSHAAEEGEGGGGLPQLNIETYPSQIFWLLIVFFLLYFLCAQIFLPRVGNIIEERRNRLADDYDKAAELKTQAEEAEASYLKALADAKARAAQIAAETRASIDAEIAEMSAETDRQLEMDIEAAEARIAETAAKASEGVREAARDVTKELVAALIDETPSDDSVDAALTRVGA